MISVRLRWSTNTQHQAYTCLLKLAPLYNSCASNIPVISNWPFTFLFRPTHTRPLELAPLHSSCLPHICLLKWSCYVPLTSCTHLSYEMAIYTALAYTCFLKQATAYSYPALIFHGFVWWAGQRRAVSQ
jgi:hypothetical protein